MFWNYFTFYNDMVFFLIVILKSRDFYEIHWSNFKTCNANASLTHLSFLILKCNLFLISLKRVNSCFEPSFFSCNTFYKFWRENSCLKHTQDKKKKPNDLMGLSWYHVHTIELNYQFKTFTLAFSMAGKVTQPNFTRVKADKLSRYI